MLLEGKTTGLSLRIDQFATKWPHRDYDIAQTMKITLILVYPNAPVFLKVSLINLNGARA